MNKFLKLVIITSFYFRRKKLNRENFVYNLYFFQALRIFNNSVRIPKDGIEIAKVKKINT